MKGGGDVSDQGRQSILVVDNDPSVLQALVARLASVGYCCESACSGGQALSLFQAHGADLVISDLNMPGGDGGSLADNLRRISDVPIIIISGFADASQTKLGDIKNVQFLKKPFETSQLLDLINEVFGIEHAFAAQE